MAAYQCLNCGKIERSEEDCCSKPDLFCINDMPGEILKLRAVLADAALAAQQQAAPAHARQPLHVTHLIDWLAARYRAAGGKEGITDVSAWAEEVMRWTEEQHGITVAQKGE